MVVRGRQPYTGVWGKLGEETENGEEETEVGGEAAATLSAGIFQGVPSAQPEPLHTLSLCSMPCRG